MTPLEAVQLVLAVFTLVGLGIGVGQFRADLQHLRREVREVREGHGAQLAELRRDLDQRTLRRIVRDTPPETRYERPKTPLPLPPSDDGTPA